MKHEVLIAHFKKSSGLNKRYWKELSDVRKNDFMENVFSCNRFFRNEMRGLVIRQFTLEEYSQYTKVRELQTE